MELDLTILCAREDDWWLATIPELPGAFSQGKSREEARMMVLDALALMSEHRRDEVAEEDFVTVEPEMPTLLACRQ